MPALKKTTAKELNTGNDKVERSHANDPYVLEKIKLAKAFIKQAGLPSLSKTN